MGNEKWHFVRSFVFENIVYENMRTGYHFRRVYIWVALQALQIRRIFFFFFFTIRGHGNFRPIWGIFLLRAIAPINRARISRIYSDVYYTEFWLNVTVLRAFSNSISCTKLLYKKKTQKKKTYIPNSNLFQQTQLDIRFSVPRHEISAWYYSCFDNNAK